MAGIRYLRRLGQRILCDARHLRELRRVGAIRGGWRSLYPNLPHRWIRREHTTELGTWRTAETDQGYEWLGGDPVPSDKEKLVYILERNNGHNNHSTIRRLFSGNNVASGEDNPKGQR